MYESAFAYNLTRSYPYPWFTWLVVVGGIAATALFSVVSIAANVSNPNETENPSSPKWYEKQPWSLANKVRARCQDQIFPVGSKGYTTSSEFYHVIQSIYKSSLETSETSEVSLAYHHSALEACTVERISIAAWPIGYNFSAVSSCTVYSSQAPVSIDLQTPAQAVDFLGYKGPSSWFRWMGMFQQLLIKACLVELAAMSKSTSWTAWAEYSFHDYIDQTANISVPNILVSLAATVRYSNRTLSVYGGSNYSRNVLNSSGTNPKQSVLSLDTWSRMYGMDALRALSSVQEHNDNFKLSSNSVSRDQQTLNFSNPMVSLAVTADNLVRLIYSGMMSDFGQASATNLLADPLTVWEYARALDDMSKFMGGGSIWRALTAYQTNEHLPAPYVFNDTTRQNVSTLFAWANTTIPTVSPTFLEALYLCQVPRLKPVLSLIFAVVIADLVFLQALWIVFSFLVKLFLERRDDMANYCVGCTRIIQEKDSVSHVEPASLHNDSEPRIDKEQPLTVSTFEVLDTPFMLRRRPVGAPPRPPAKTPDESATLL